MDRNAHPSSDSGNNLAQLEQAIRDFIEARGTPGIMPTTHELKQAGRSDLLRAISKHGGMRAVAEYMSLQYVYPFKPKGYWDDFAHVEEALRTYNEQHGTQGVMLTAQQLKKAGLSGLLSILPQHGGSLRIAQRLGWQYSSTAKPANYWNDIGNLERELFAFIETHGTPGVMPTVQELVDGGRGDLPSVIFKYGGVEAVAKQFGLEMSYTRRPAGYWDDFDHVAEAITTYIETHGTPGIMPTYKELRQADFGDLPSFISKHGGRVAIAQRLGLQVTSISKSSGYWNDLAQVGHHLFAFIENQGTPGIMPTASALSKAQQRSLVHAIYKHGGFSAVAQQFGLAYERQPAHYWDNFANVEQVFLAFNEEQGALGIMPTVSMLRKAGYSGLADALHKHGGREAVAKRLGWLLTRTTKPRGFWNDFEQVEGALGAIMEECGTPGIMPTYGELRKAGRNDLLIAINRKHGGMDAVAHRLGAQLTPQLKPGGYWGEFANVEREIYTLLEGFDCPNLLPSLESLRKMGYSSLVSAICAHGGIEAVAKRLGLTPASAIKKPRRWERFSDVEQALLVFIKEHGTPGMMPTLEELKRAGRGDLVKAIQRHGRFPIIAERLGLKMRHTKKPIHYWDEIAHVEEELQAFIDTYGTPGAMPTQDELLQAGRGDLIHAIQRQGGFSIIAERLGLKMLNNKKPAGYWDEIAHVEEGLRVFINTHGTLGVMPTVGQLTVANRSDLASAIAKHGGFRTVAELLGLEMSYVMKTPGYWDSWSNVERELNAFIDAHGTPGVMPAREELLRVGRGDLSSALSKHDGSISVATRLGLALPFTAKPHGYWDDFSHVEQELHSFIDTYGTPEVMPTLNDLKKAGRMDLIGGIQRHGRFHAVAERLGLKRASPRKPQQYWDITNLERELQTFIEKHGGVQGVMPTRKELIQASRGDLVNAIKRNGKVLAVAQQLGLKIAGSKKPNGYWDDFAYLEEEIHRFIHDYGLPGIMPTPDQFRRWGRSDLDSAMNRHGGRSLVADRLGLVLLSSSKPDGYWNDFANVEREVLDFIKVQGTEGVMPTSSELRRAGRNDLIIAITRRHGGVSSVANRLGLHYNGREFITPRTVADLEGIARSIQPLAESNLLSGSQVMVILRRAGMLDYHNRRITRLNMSMVQGKHEAIEETLRQLRIVPDEIVVDEDSLDEDSAGEFEETDVESLVSSDIAVQEPEKPSSSFPPPTRPDIQQEQAVIRGLTAIGAIRLPLDETLGQLTSKILWEAFYKRLYAWYGSLYTSQRVTSEDIRAAILAAYPEHEDNEFIEAASTRFIAEVERAVNFAARLSDYGWTGPQLRLHQADAACRMADVLQQRERQAFLLNADDPGMGKSAAFIAAVAASNIIRVVLIAPKTVADDTWSGNDGEIHRCLRDITIVRGLQETLHAFGTPSTSLTFFVLHYEELQNVDALSALTSQQFDCLCIDEVHFVKQRSGKEETLRRVTLETLRKAARTSIGLTGTPLVNELAEPMAILQLLSLHDPQFDYARLSNHRMSDVADVFEAMLPHIVRRRKKDVLLHLPACDVRTIDLPLMEDLVERVQEISCWPRIQTSMALLALRRLSLEAKLPYIRERARKAKKLLVLTYLTDEVSEKIMEDLEDFFPGQVAHINGSIPRPQREQMLDSFRNPQGVRVLVGTIGTIGVGLTLFERGSDDTAHEIIVADLPYTAAEFDQGIARLHREGQQHRVTVDVLQTTTNVYLADGSPLLTVDQRVWHLILGKRELSDIAIDGKYHTTDAAMKVRKALHSWLKQVREIGIEPLVIERRSAEQSDAQRWRGEIARLRGMSAAKADELFANPDYTAAFLDHLRTSSASRLAHQWLRGKLEPTFRTLHAQFSQKHS